MISQRNFQQPLSTSSGSKWKEWFEDKSVLGRIDSDLYRTFPETGFFSVNDVLTRDGQALEDILFVYSKVNKGMGYVQGMNEVIAPIYLVFHDDPNFDDLEQLETDVFFCFSNLMGEINECFIQKNGTATLDTTWTIGRFQALLAMLDKDLFLHLHKLNVDPRFYGVRWLSLLFAQEFQLSDLLTLWDTMFGDPHRFEFLLFFACAMVINLKPALMKADFGTALITLQNYPEIDVADMIRKAKQLRVRVPRGAITTDALSRVIDSFTKDETAVSDAMQNDQEEINNAAIAFVYNINIYLHFYYYYHFNSIHFYRNTRNKRVCFC